MKQIITLILIIFTSTNFAQSLIIIDGETGKPVEEVTVFNKNKTKSAITNIEGLVDISAFSVSEIIYVSHVSYVSLKVTKKSLEQNAYKLYVSKQSEFLDEVVVSVFKGKEKTNRIAEQIAVIEKKDIARVSPQTSADLLATVPGIKVQKSQFGGGSPVLRGMESNRVLLVVDGVRMNNAIYRKGHLQNSITVSPNLLERTEVIFGPSSVIYGSDALGGVIHYYTRTPQLSKEKEVGSSLFSRFSTVNNEVTTSVSAELRFPKWASYTNVSYSDFGDLKMGKNRSHGFNDWGKVFFYSENSNGNYEDSPSSNSEPSLQRNTGFSQIDILQKFYIPLSKKTDLKFNVQYSTSSNIPRFDRLTEMKQGILKFAEWYYGPQERVLISPQLEINPKKSWLENGTFTLAYQNIKESRIQRKFGSLEKSYKRENLNAYTFNGDFSVDTNRHRTLGYGFEFVYNDVGSSSEGQILTIENDRVIGSSGTFPVQTRYADGGSSYSSSAAYVDYRQDISKNATLNSGLRFTYTNLNAEWIDDTFFSLPERIVNLSSKAVTATLGYVYKPNKTWQLNTVLSTGFRSPNIDDVGKVREKNGDVTVPNTNLKPEHAYNAEVGAQKYFNERRFRIGANVYYTFLRNYIYRESFSLNGNSTIAYEGEDGNVVANVNKGNAYITGFTASYQGKLHNCWTTSGSVTYTQGQTYDTDEPMSSIPPLFGNFDVNFVNNQFEAGVNLRFNATKHITEYNLTEGIDNQVQTPIVNNNATEDINKYYGTPSWMTAGIRTQYSLNKSVILQARMDNIFDEHYKEFASGISAPGRNFSVALSINL